MKHFTDKHMSAKGPIREGNSHFLHKKCQAKVTDNPRCLKGISSSVQTLTFEHSASLLQQKKKSADQISLISPLSGKLPSQPHPTTLFVFPNSKSPKRPSS